MINRILSTSASKKLIDELVSIHGPVVFHQSGGCCDGSAPMCYPRNEFKVGSRDIFLGFLEKQPFFIAEDQFVFWEHTQLIIDVVDGRGGMFSIEGSTGKRFLTRSKVFNDEELKEIKNDPPVKAKDIDFIDGLETTS